jgi:hypothetical protein
LAPHIWFFHYWAKAVCALFFRVVIREGLEDHHLHRQFTRPRLYVLNHTNSFLDPVLFAVKRRQSLYFLARGDVLFGFAWGLLPRIFPLLPVWRRREGHTHLKGNYSTFERCFEVWSRGEAVVIFSEGLCENRLGLKPLLKGTARLVWQSFERGLDLEVLPVGVCYEHYDGTGKAARVCFGEPLPWQSLAEHATSPAHFYQLFNADLAPAMAACMVDPEEKGFAANYWPSLPPRKSWQQMMRFLSRIFHATISFPMRKLAQALTQGTVHFDAVYFVALMLAYPIVLLLSLMMGICLFPMYAFYICLGVALLPVLALMGR